jgi:hypothetical protein
MPLKNIIILISITATWSFSVTPTTPITSKAYESPVFPKDDTKRTTPSTVDNVEIELPDFEQLYNRIRYTSPLASMVMDNIDGDFQTADKLYKSDLKWKTLESHPKRTVHKIEKIENFQKLGCPIVRFRASIDGPCIGMKFVDYIVNEQERAKWDPQIDKVTNLYPAYDVNDGNIETHFKYGEFKMLGVGYTLTKPYMMIDGREQLTLCALQELPNKGALIWGVELEPHHDDKFPSDTVRHTRARTHLFSVALAPTKDGKSFDAEYVLQLDCGGNLPSFVTTMVLIDTVKHMFDAAKKDFGNEEMMKPWIQSIDDTKDDMIAEQFGILVPP